MVPAFVVRYRPAGPWRIGPDSGARDQLDCVYHSDTLFSAVSNAMLRLGMLPEWLAATAGSPETEEPAVRFSSCFPWLGNTLFAVPPRTLWPPTLSPKLRWKGARFVPLKAIASLLAEEPLNEDRWMVDGASTCLLSHDSRRSGPFRLSSRSFGAVDRLSGNVAVHRAACLEFSENAGLWAVATFAGEAARERWSGPVKAALRLLADTGLGGGRTIGWGHCEPPEFRDGPFPEILLGPAGETPALPGTEPQAADPPNGTAAWWLLSVFSPAPAEAVDWQRGSYSLVARGGRIESPIRSGGQKRVLKMVEEGSVLVAGSPLRGTAQDVAPEGFPHPVFRAGFAVAVPMPLRLAERAFTTL
jgi:CRISPR type III-A-associated RAMP protein Csm4